MSYKVICALGDSITAGYWDEEGQGGWFGRLQQLVIPAYPYQYGFCNLAKDGDRSPDLLMRLQGELVSREPNCLIIAAGTNDILRWHRPDGPTDMSADYRDEIWQSIISTAQRMLRDILVIGPMPVQEDRFPSAGIFGRQYYQFNQDIADYNAMIKAKCERRGVAFADYTGEMVTAGLENILHDSTHPNARGHQLIAELTFAKLKSIGWVA